MNYTRHPVAEVRDGELKVAIYREEPEQAGSPTRYKGRLTRGLLDSGGQWHDTHNLSGTDYLRAARLLERAYDEERAQQAADRETVRARAGAA